MARRAPPAHAQVDLVGVALRLASVAHIIRDGVIAVTGAARDLVDNPDVVKSYLGG